MRLILLIFYFLVAHLQIFGQPENDNCETAIQLNAENGGCFINASLIHATQSLPADICNSSLVQDVWFSFTADSVFHNISVNPSSGMDAVVEVRKGNACSGIYIGCIDEGGGDGAIENLGISDLVVGTEYFIRIYDFTGVGNPPSTWTFDICVSGFSPEEPPEIQLLSPKGGESFQAGEIVFIEAEIQGVISGKEIELSIDNGETWERIWQSSDTEPILQYDWQIPSLNAERCLIRAAVFQSGEIFEDTTPNPFSIVTSENPPFILDPELSHLYWPFYNPDLLESGTFHVPSEWQNQEKGVLITSNDVVNTWFFLNDHYWQSSGRWHHSGDNCFAQDWNFINGGNSDCGMYFFSPMSGRVLYTDRDCFNMNCDRPTCTSGCGNFIVVQSLDDPAYAYRACHFSELNPALQPGDEVAAGDWIARIGNEGSSTAAHLHFVLYKNLNFNDLEVLSAGGILRSNRDQNIDPNKLSDLCFDKAANFRFDVSLTGEVTNIPPVFYEPEQEITLFPNPNNGTFTLQLDTEVINFKRIIVIDPLGRIVVDRTETGRANQIREEVQLTRVVPGIYYVNLYFDQEIIRKKMVVR